MYHNPAWFSTGRELGLILSTVCEAMAEGLEERKVEKVDAKEEEAAAPKAKRARVGRRKAAETEAPVAEEAAE